MNYWVHPAAEAELGDAAIHYSQHASLQVAQAFLAEFERVVDMLVENPARGYLTDSGLRTYNFAHFPYRVVYEEDAAGPRLYAVAHQHRGAGYWLARA
jgi:plasmid stabilization system protein ParE